MSARRVFFTGAREMLPIVLGSVPFGLIAGVASAQIGLSVFEATAASVVIFAGSAQLAAYDLLDRGAHYLIVLITALVINLRFAIYSASIAPEFQSEKKLHRWLYAYLLTDQAFALTVARRAQEPNAEHTVAYYLGGAVALWIMWIASTSVGAAAGAAIPPAWSLDFAVPLCFVALLAPLIKDSAQVFCAVVTGIASLLLIHAPHNSVVILSVIIGLAATLGFERWRTA
jgi:4-azaleucine resistance transporter AzlC